MKTNLSSQITLNRVSPRYYRPENAFERSVLTRLEKIPTDIYESPEEGANQIALDIAQMIRDKQKAGRFCVLHWLAATHRAMSIRPLCACIKKKD